MFLQLPDWFKILYVRGQKRGNPFYLWYLSRPVKRKWHVGCKEVRCCCIYYYQTLKISIFCSYYVHWITRRLCLVRHPSAAGCSKCLAFSTFEIWEICHFCVKVGNSTTNFVVKRCKYKYWIAFCRCSRAIWIASERIANFHAPLTLCI